MCRFESGAASAVIGFWLVFGGPGAWAQAQVPPRQNLAATAAAAPYGLGQPASARAIAAWDIDVSADGTGLPPGRGSVAAGQAIYAAQCAACHGAKGEGKPADALVGGQGSLASDRPLKTIGSFWPYATTVYDFIRRAMPYNAPQSLAPDEVYAVTAYLLHLNGIVPVDTVLDAQNLARVRMPNRLGFVADQRPDTASSPCVTCR
jgi:cytochrome c